jgi:aminopeptidase
MSDIRLQRLADVLVNYSTQVQPGDWVGILGDTLALPALREVYKSVLRAGGNPVPMISDEQMARTFLRNANEGQMAWLDPAQTTYYEQADVYIRVGSSNNTRAMTGIPATRVQQRRAAEHHWLNTRLERSGNGDFRWVGTWYPCEASAQEAKMSLEEYEDFVYGATFCNLEDPVAEWKKLSAMQQEKVDWLKGKKQVKVTGPNVDITLSIDGRTFVNSDGKANMPSGEIFTGPVEESVNGWARFGYPMIVGGRAVSAWKCALKTVK